MQRLSLIASLILAVAYADSPEHPFLTSVRDQAAAWREGDAPVTSIEEWNARRVELREQLLEAWGGFPEEPCALQPRILATLERDGYKVEKLIFQTLPGVWMTANAYVPTNTGPFPGVLCVHGHWPGAKQDPHVQARCIGLVKQGYFVLAVDAFGAGERGIGTALGEYHGEMVAATLWPLGRPLSGIQVYENVRAVDYMLTRREVNRDKLGVTGASGGGNQTMYASAWDNRFKASVPVCSVGNYQAYLGAACCMCEVVPGALSFTEEWEILGLTAPGALMIINASEDARQFSIAEAKKSIELAESVFKVTGAPHSLRHATFESKHDYNQPMREAMYGWMNLHLKDVGDGSPVPEPAMTLEEPESLRCFPGESRPADWQTLPQYAALAGRAHLAQRSAPRDRAAWTGAMEGIRERLDVKVLGGTTPVVGPLAPTSPRFAGNPSSVDLRKATLITLSLDEAGAAQAAAFTTESGGNALILNLRATGEQSYSSDAIGRALDHNTAEWALWLGKPLLGQWIMDLRAGLDELEAAGNDLKHLSIAGFGPAGLVAVCSAAIDLRIQHVISIGALGSFITDVPYEGQRLGLMAPGILRDAGDIPRIAALIAPRSLTIKDAVWGSGQTLDEEALRRNFLITRKVFTLMGNETGFTLLPTPQ